MWKTKIQWTNKFRSVLALRGDDDKCRHQLDSHLCFPIFPDSGQLCGANSGSATKFLPSPKVSLIFGPWAKTEFYVQGGFSFHSNDARGATQNYEPISPDYPFPNAQHRNFPL